MSTTLQNKKVKIRKSHKCFSCLRVFPVGTNMNYWSGIYEGDFSAVYSCMTCVDLMNNHSGDHRDEGFPYGYVSEWVEKGQTPEDLLKELEEKRKFKA